MEDEELLERLDAITQQLGLLERKVDFLLARSGERFSDQASVPDEIGQLILNGDLIGAIKLYRQRHGVDLAEAKRSVEKLRARLGA